MLWGISSNGRAPASHAGSTGIDTRILQDKSFNFATMVTTFYSLISLFHILFARVVWQDVLHKIAVFTLYSSGTAAKVLVVHSLSPAAEEGKDLC